LDTAFIHNFYDRAQPKAEASSAVADRAYIRNNPYRHWIVRAVDDLRVRTVLMH